MLSQLYYIYACELFANCDSVSKNKLNVLYNNIARYIFNRKRFSSISDYSKRIFEIKFDDLLKLRTLTLLHKIIYKKQPDYLYDRLRFTRSVRNNKIVPIKHSSLISERQFFLFATRLWNSLPSNLTFINSAVLFKNQLLKHFKNSYSSQN